MAKLAVLPKLKKDRTGEKASNAARMRMYRRRDPEYYLSRYLEYKAANPDKFKKYSRARYGKVREFIRSCKEVPCKDCGLEFPHYLMDFDHCRGKKSFNVTHVAGGIPSLKREMAKCDIVCCMCHRERTWFRRVKCV